MNNIREEMALVEKGEPIPLGLRLKVRRDQVLGDHQTVIKNRGRCYRHVNIVSGATVLGNGSVALILDPHRLAQEAIRTMSIGPRADRALKARAPGVAR